MRWALAAAAFVAVAGTWWFWFVGQILSDVEHERTELNATGQRCGMNPRS